MAEFSTDLPESQGMLLNGQSPKLTHRESINRRRLIYRFDLYPHEFLAGGRRWRFFEASLRLLVPVIGIRESQTVHRDTMKSELFKPSVD